MLNHKSASGGIMLEIVVEENVHDYLNKNGSNNVIIDMIPDRTSACCGTGKTKKFYVPFIRIPGVDEKPEKGYTMFQSKGINIYISEKALLAANETITIFIEKTLIISNLAVKGIDLYIPETNNQLYMALYKSRGIHRCRDSFISLNIYNIQPICP